MVYSVWGRGVVENKATEMSNISKTKGLHSTFRCSPFILRVRGKYRSWSRGILWAHFLILEGLFKVNSLSITGLAIIFIILMKVKDGNGTPLQHSCLENPTNRGAWWAAVLGVAKSQTKLSNWTTTTHLRSCFLFFFRSCFFLTWTIFTFESVLMRRMKLEPIIQSEVSQKEKHQYSILMHIYGI